MVVLIPIFLTACARSDTRLTDAAGDIGRLRAADQLADLPSDCRRLAQAGVREGDRLDVALLATDAALDRQRARTVRCATWYDDLRAGIAQGPQ
jgi:hypothetical protein